MISLIKNIIVGFVIVIFVWVSQAESEKRVIAKLEAEIHHEGK